MGGHLFVINGDLTKLACDAILIPTDDKLHDREAVGAAPARRRLPSDWGDDKVVSILGRGGAPAVWLGNVGRYGDDNVAGPYLDVAGAYVEAALATLPSRSDDGSISGRSGGSR